MATYSKLLGEHIIVTGSNDKFVVTSSGSVDSTITITSQRYRDIDDLADEVEEQLTNTVTGQTWAIATNTSTGIMSFTSNASFTVNFDTTNYGESLRDKFGFESNSVGSTSNVVTGTLQHEGGLYPSEPVENDSRPSEAGSDRYDTDFQSVTGRTGALFGRGGGNKIYFRDFSVLLPQADLEDYSNFITYLGQGRSFAFYHDRDEEWPGPSNEYTEYSLVATGDGGIRYDPTPINASNKIWHRASFSCNKYVEP